MNFDALFVTARVTTAIYRIVSTALLLGYIAKRVAEKKPIGRKRKRAIFSHEFESDDED